MTQEKLAEIFERQLPNGMHVYDDQQVRTVLPALFLLSGGEVSSIESAELKDLMQDFCKLIEIDPKESRDAIAKRAAAHYRKHPPNTTLMRELQAACA